MDTVPDSSSFSFPAAEDAILDWWDEVDAFGEQLKRNEGGKPFVFYDGPPFATGLPHYGHLLAGTIKDVVTRYAAATGHHVPRRFG
jgi:isoleucyl-tRNA synthetase